MIKKAMYPGSFDPFTNGHLDIVRKASEIFDEVHIVIAVNANKKRKFSQNKMKEAIKQALKREKISNCKVVVYVGLVGKYAIENSIYYIVRGLRNSMDYNYEENIAEVNKFINPDLEYVYFRADNTAISSSMVRELSTYLYDVSEFVPREVSDVL